MQLREIADFQVRRNMMQFAARARDTPFIPHQTQYFFYDCMRLFADMSVK